MAAPNHTRSRSCSRTIRIPRICESRGVRSLTAAGYSVSVVAPRAPGQPRREHIDGVDVFRFRAGSTVAPTGLVGFLVEYVVAGRWRFISPPCALSSPGPPCFISVTRPTSCSVPALMFRLAGRKVSSTTSTCSRRPLAVKFGAGALLAASPVGVVFQRLDASQSPTTCSPTNASYAEVAMSSGRKARPRMSRSCATLRRGVDPAAVAVLRRGCSPMCGLPTWATISAQDGAEGLAPVLASLRDRPEPVDAQLTIIGDGDARPCLRPSWLAWPRRSRRPSRVGGDLTGPRVAPSGRCVP